MKTHVKYLNPTRNLNEASKGNNNILETTTKVNNSKRNSLIINKISGMAGQKYFHKKKQQKTTFS